MRGKKNPLKFHPSKEEKAYKNRIIEKALEIYRMNTRTPVKQILAQAITEDTGKTIPFDSIAEEMQAYLLRCWHVEQKKMDKPQNTGGTPPRQHFDLTAATEEFKNNLSDLTFVQTHVAPDDQRYDALIEYARTQQQEKQEMRTTLRAK